MLVGEGKPSQIKKWKHQRAERGFSDYDIFEIDTWFLMIMPEMLEELIKHNNGYPSSFENEYIEEHNLNLFTITSEQRDEIDKYCFSKWQKTLKEMKNAFIRSNKLTYFIKNKYKEEYDKLWNEYFEVYGHNGEKLKGNVTKECIKDKNGKVIQTYYSAIKTYRFEDMSEENKRISRLYHTEERRIDNRFELNKKKALEMFVKYFDNLWY